MSNMIFEEENKWGVIDVYPNGKPAFSSWRILTKDFTEDGIVENVTVDFGRGENTIESARAYANNILELCERAEQIQRERQPSPRAERQAQEVGG